MPDIGDSLVFSSRLYGTDPSLDSSAQLVNATAVALTITLPDGTIASGITVVNPPVSVGVYTYKYTGTSIPGTYVGRWLFTLSDGSTSAFVQQFDVQPTTALLLGLDEAKRQLRINPTDTAQDENIRDWLAALTRPIEHMVGACTPHVITNELAETAGYVIRTRLTPVISVQSLVPCFAYGVSYATADLTVTDEGRVVRVSGLPFFSTAYFMTYTIGRTTVPANVRMAVRIILQHLWATSRGAAQPAYLGGDDTSVIPGLGYAIPNRAMELLQVDQRGPAVG
jgi:hypothetical protein